MTLKIRDGGIEGKLIARCRRSMIMELDGFQKFAGEIEESDEEIRENNLEYSRDKVEP